MRVAQHTFLRMPDWLLRFLTGPVPRDHFTNDVCLITFVDVAQLECAVLASDGRFYHAMELRRWLLLCENEGRSACVVPGCPIDTVALLAPLHTHRILHHYGRLRRFWRTRGGTIARKEPPMLLRVLTECNRRRHAAGMRKGGRSLRVSDPSAFVRV